MTHTVEVPVPAELLDALDQRVRLHHAGGRSEFLLELLRRELHRPLRETAERPRKTMEQVLAPIQESVRKSGMTDEEVNALLDETLATVRRERQKRKARMSKD